jgi:hypothetical protein
MDVLEVVLLSIAALLSAYVLLVVALRTMRPLRRLAAETASGFAEPVSSVFEDRARERRFEQLEAEVQRMLGERDPWGDEARGDIVEAAVAAQQINILNQTLRSSVQRCLATHWAVAEGSGAIHMSEAARHPLSRHFRQRVMDLSDLLGHRLAAYPLLVESPELIRLQLGLRWIPGTCVTCPYWSTTVADAPRVCPTAKAMSSRATSRNTSVVDAEIVDECEP